MHIKPTKLTRGGSARAATPSSDSAVAFSAPEPEATSHAAEPTAPSKDVFELDQALDMCRTLTRVAYALHGLSGLALSVVDNACDGNDPGVYGALRSACDTILAAVRDRQGELHDEHLRRVHE